MLAVGRPRHGWSFAMQPDACIRRRPNAWRRIFFQPHIYRADQGVVLLHSGKFTMDLTPLVMVTLVNSLHRKNAFFPMAVTGFP